MSDKMMEESRTKWKQKAKLKAAENRKLKKHLKRLTEKLNQAQEELQKYQNPTSEVKDTFRSPAKDEKKSPKNTGSS